MYMYVHVLCLSCSGGITLTFSGCDMDVVGDPVLVVSSGGVTRRDTSSVGTSQCMFMYMKLWTFVM